jgi:hypothetical protein
MSSGGSGGATSVSGGGSSATSDGSSWRFRFPDVDIMAEMVSSLWNKFLWPLLRFVVVRSNYGKRNKSVP